MNLQTTRFGEIECPEEIIMAFPDGVLGFPDDRRFILLEHDHEGSHFKWLQSVDSPGLAFIVIDPLSLDETYRCEIDVDTARCIGTDSPAECALMCIVNIPRDEPIAMTVNLKAPLVVNVENRVGRQVILSSNVYAIGTPLFSQMPQQQAAMAS